MSKKYHIFIYFFILIFFFSLIHEIYSTKSNVNSVLNPMPWDHSPITVYIDNINVPEHYSPTYIKQVENALDYWENGGNRKLKYDPKFSLADTENEADIYIMWVENLEEYAGVKKGVAGIARPYEVNGKYMRVNIILEVGNYQGYSWKQYGDANMLELVKHELGHALGLGHSNDRRDIMYPTYEQKDNIDPLLVNRTRPLIYLFVIVSLILAALSGINWLRYRRKRRVLEDEFL